MKTMGLASASKRCIAKPFRVQNERFERIKFRGEPPVPASTVPFRRPQSPHNTTQFLAEEYSTSTEALLLERKMSCDCESDAFINSVMGQTMIGLNFMSDLIQEESDQRLRSQSQEVLMLENTNNHTPASFVPMERAQSAFLPDSLFDNLSDVPPSPMDSEAYPVSLHFQSKSSSDPVI